MFVIQDLALKGENYRGSIAKCVSPDWILEIPPERDFPCSLSKNIKTLKGVRGFTGQY